MTNENDIIKCPYLKNGRCDGEQEDCYFIRFVQLNKENGELRRSLNGLSADVIELNLQNDHLQQENSKLKSEIKRLETSSKATNLLNAKYLNILKTRKIILEEDFMAYRDEDSFDFVKELFGQFATTKDQILQMYIDGRINKEEFLRKMKEIDR